MTVNVIYKLIIHSLNLTLTQMHSDPCTFLFDTGRGRGRGREREEEEQFEKPMPNSLCSAVECSIFMHQQMQ